MVYIHTACYIYTYMYIQIYVFLIHRSLLMLYNIYICTSIHCTIITIIHHAYQNSIELFYLAIWIILQISWVTSVLVFDSSVLLWFKHVKNPSYHGDFFQKTEPTYSANRQQDAPLAAAKALWPTTSASAIPVTSKHQPSGIVIW